MLRLQRQVSVDPEVILKLMFLLFLDNVKCERELMRMLPERLDYLWFLGFALGDEIPDHSVLSRAPLRAMFCHIACPPPREQASFP